MMKPLRDYQRAACEAFYDHIHEGGKTSLIELATGLGKSLVAATITKELIDAYVTPRVLYVTHTRELVQQSFQEMIGLWPQAPAGINSAGLGRRDWQSQIIFSGIQSIYRHTGILGPVDLVIVDECQLIPRAAQGMYHQLFASLRERKPKMRVLGLTATPFRLDSGRLDSGDDALFEKTVYKYGIAEGVQDGYLSPLVSKAMTAEIDTSKVHTRAGEFVNAELEAAAMAGANVPGAVDEILAYGEDRRAWLIFCVSIKHAEAVAAEMKRRGVGCGVVTSETPKRQRDDLVSAFSRGDLRALANVNVLSIGFNVPHVDLIALLRPTQSPGLAIQQIGRGTRLAPGKQDCLVLDFGRILKTHGPIDRMEPPERKKRKKGERALPEPIKICPYCNAIMRLGDAVCDQCGKAYPRQPHEVKHDATADGESVILSTQVAPCWVPVTKWRITLHQARKEGQDSRPCLRITYLCGVSGIVNEFLPFEAGKAARAIAGRRWVELCGNQLSFVPQTAQEAFERSRELRRPARISIIKDGRYFRVVGHEFKEVRRAA